MRTTTMTSGALSLLVCAALLGGCSDGAASPESDPGPSSTDTSPSASEPDPEPSEPSVEPATGAEVEVGSLTVTFPQGFAPREASSIGGELVTGFGPDGAARIAVNAAKDFNQQSLDKAVDLAIETGFWTRTPKRFEDVEVDGVTMYHLSGPSDFGGTDIQFGAEHGGYDVTLTIGAPGDAAEQQQLVDSILATATWQ